MYDPTVGRFLTEDPSDFEAGDLNLYRYVKNDPLNNTDPSGLCSAYNGPFGVSYDTWTGFDPIGLSGYRGGFGTTTSYASSFTDYSGYGSRSAATSIRDLIVGGSSSPTESLALSNPFSSGSVGPLSDNYGLGTDFDYRSAPIQAVTNPTLKNTVYTNGNGAWDDMGTSLYLDRSTGDWRYPTSPDMSEPSSGQLTFDAATSLFGGKLLAGAAKAVGPIAKVLMKAPLIGKGVTAEAAELWANAVSKTVSTISKTEAWNELSPIKKAYYDIGQQLTTSKTNKLLSCFGKDVASTVAKGQFLAEGLGKTGLLNESIAGAGELGLNTIKNILTGATGENAAFGVGKWLATEGTPAASQWLNQNWKNLVALSSSAISSYLSRTNTRKQ
jgi:hypothetical protein